MPLIVEDGSIVAGADSYISLPDARTLAVNWGLDLPVDDAKCEIALRRGAQYLGLLESQYSGTRTDDAQALSWPRTDATRYSIALNTDEIHPDLQLAQVEAAAVYGSGTSVRTIDDGRQVTSEEIGGTLKLAYQNTSGSNNVTITPSDDLLEPFFDTASLNSFEVHRG